MLIQIYHEKDETVTDNLLMIIYVNKIENWIQSLD